MMIFLIFFLVVVSPSAFANEGVSQNDLVIAAPSATSSGCNLAASGIKDKQKFLNFFQELKSSVKSGDKEKISSMVNYPITCAVKKTRKGMSRRSLKNAVDFKNNFRIIFNSKINTVIENQKLENLFCNYQGVMFGNGEFWLGVNSEGALGIKAINN